MMKKINFGEFKKVNGGWLNGWDVAQEKKPVGWPNGWDVAQEKKPVGWPNGWDVAETGSLTTCDPPCNMGPLASCDPPCKIRAIG